MSTYEELQLIVSIGILIVAILTYTHKNKITE
ncbi:putative holin-like toxin [Frisingicoccus sp.]